MADIIVVGGGHAGCEAAIVAAKLNKKVVLITSNINNIADLPCNPSIGGSAKGVVVREVDALGGVIGKIADQSQIQMKKLNSKKGPAVQAYRAQIDKDFYQQNMLKELKKHPNIQIIEAMIEDLIVEEKKVQGVKTENESFFGKAVILTTGTYLKADILIGDKRRRSGPGNEKPSLYLSDNLKKLGFTIIRLKTGTPPRIAEDSIDYTKVAEEKGSSEHLYFSNFYSQPYDINKQKPCYLTYTTEKTHQIILKNLHKSSMYGGIDDLESVGPRYCPSIEDKVVRFQDKPRHQLFLEPVGLNSKKIYIQGFSTSLPTDVQEKIVHSIPGLEKAKILTDAYAIEYDAVMPTQLKQNLETKMIKNLFMAGQINGTSGYEEAAGQGIMAGINACLNLNNKKPFILKRNEAYIGVLIDDLVTKGVSDPYRLLTSRAEYRLLLRNDNAEERLCKYGKKYAILTEKEQEIAKKNEKNLKNLLKTLKNTFITPTKEVNDYLEKIGSTKLKEKISLATLLKRTEIKIVDLSKWIELDYDKTILEKVEINIKYEGYIKKAVSEAKKMLELEKIKIPSGIDYFQIANLASEAKQKLAEINPTTIGQASRISGVNPADIAILAVYLRKR